MLVLARGTLSRCLPFDTCVNTLRFASMFEVLGGALMQMFLYGFFSAYAMSGLVVGLLLWKVFGRQLA